jgi:hypothetical protein
MSRTLHPLIRMGENPDKNVEILQRTIISVVKDMTELLPSSDSPSLDENLMLLLGNIRSSLSDLQKHSVNEPLNIEGLIQKCSYSMECLSKVIFKNKAVMKILNGMLQYLITDVLLCATCSLCSKSRNYEKLRVLRSDCNILFQCKSCDDSSDDSSEDSFHEDTIEELSMPCTNGMPPSFECFNRDLSVYVSDNPCDNCRLTAISQGHVSEHCTDSSKSAKCTTQSCSNLSFMKKNSHGKFVQTMCFNCKENNSFTCQECDKKKSINHKCYSEQWLEEMCTECVKNNSY